MPVKSQGIYNDTGFNVMAQEIVRATKISDVIGYELTVRPTNGGNGDDMTSLVTTAEDRADMDLAILSTFEHIERTLQLQHSYDLWINIFPSTLMSTTVLAKLIGMVRNSRNNYVVEITESEFMTDYEQARLAVRAIQEAGAKVVLDDFGSGAASIQSLLELPVDGIKIDRLVFQQAALDHRFMPLIEGTVATAKLLDIPVVIEGIESLGHLALARSLNVDFIQGYFVSRPSALPDTLDRLEFARHLATYEVKKKRREVVLCQSIRDNLPLYANLSR